MKINLLRDKNNDGTNATSATSEVRYETAFNIKSGQGGGGVKLDKDMLVKLIVMALGVALLMLYENYNIGELQGRLNEVTNQNAAVVAELERGRPIAEKAKKLQKEIQELEQRIDLVKKLSRTRLREIKTVDYLQNIIPERVWFTSLNFTSGNLKIEGGAMSDDQLNKLIENMENSPLFKNVILMRAVEQKNSREGTVKMFLVTSQLASVD